MKTFALRIAALIAIPTSLVSADASVLRRAQDSSTEAPTTVCSPDCTRDEFCGVDGQCYPWSCENWLKMGTWTRLGNNTSTEDVSLSCSSYNTGQQDNLHAVVFSCAGYGPGVDLPDGIHSQVFNRKCSADLEIQTFQCYELAEFTDFAFFVSQAEASPPENCTQYTTEEIANGSPTQQSYLYSVYLEEKLGNTDYLIATGPSWTSSLENTVALLSMYALVEEKPETTSSPTMDPSNTQAPSPGAVVIRGL
ncbi:MAG: hypothetical protein SGARI_002577 [Bacillariaceae sp.]